jgi:hypothetical protein
MKALTDKIIDDLIDEKKEHKGGLYNAAFCDGLTYAISTIIEFEKEAEFEEIARMMMRYLAKKYNPHCAVIITNSTAVLYTGKLSVGEVMDYIKD